ncbi:MAG: HD domain-containing protein [Stenomitos frigidus ULC029]
MSPIFLTPQFEAALIYVCRLHATQLRADGKTPYIAHLMSVAALVMESGGDEDEAIAALLHDAIEDQGGDRTRQELQHLFGDRITQIVVGCTELPPQQALSWHERKRQYLERLRHAPLSVQRVVMADKLHNVRSLLASLHQDGFSVWERFYGGKAETLWFYQALWDIFQTWGHAWQECYWLQAYGQVLEELEQDSTSS